MWQAEMELLGIHHGQIGGYLLGLWGPPSRIVEAVALHHTPNHLSYDGLCALTATHVATALVSELEQSESDGRVKPAPPELDIAYLDRTGLTSRLERWRELASETCGREMAPLR